MSYRDDQRSTWLEWLAIGLTCSFTLVLLALVLLTWFTEGAG